MQNHNIIPYNYWHSLTSMSVPLSGDYMVTLQRLNLLCSDTTTALLHEFVWPRVKSLRVKYIFPGRSKVDFVQSLLLLQDCHIRLLMVRTVGVFFFFFYTGQHHNRGFSRKQAQGCPCVDRSCCWEAACGAPFIFCAWIFVVFVFF